MRSLVAALTICVCVLMAALARVATAAPPQPPAFSPTALATSPKVGLVFVACASANEVRTFDTTSANVVRVTPMPASPLGLTLSSDGASLYVTCAAPTSTVCIVNTATGKIAAT
ncbi:MAG: hypothetical protein Q7S40_11625, partial [Opitutaceae bacterium]|nr:hypothetical protein [Opitutaceae bacterium]